MKITTKIIKVIHKQEIGLSFIEKIVINHDCLRFYFNNSTDCKMIDTATCCLQITISVGMLLLGIRNYVEKQKLQNKPVSLKKQNKS